MRSREEVGSTSDPVKDYAKSVLAGDVIAGRLVRLACSRHLRDLEEGPARGLSWDAEAAARAIGFFGFLQHSKGEWAGQPLILQPWQQFVIGSIFGWKRADGARRFRIAYDEWARKNGKSTVAAGVGIYLAFFDGEPGAECYTCATKRDQARIVHSEAIRMVRAAPHLRKRIQILKDNLSSPATNSKYEPLGKDADSTDGLNPSGVIVDELHAHKTREMLDVLETAMGARREPLMFIITTAGVAGTPTVCLEMHNYGVKVLQGQIEDDSFFAFITALDEGDSWQDESCWPKANPNLGVSVKVDYLREKCKKAVEMPSAQAAFRQKHLDEWVQSFEVWIPDDRWMVRANTASVDSDALKGRECYGGLDLANTLDLAAFALVFPGGAEKTVQPPQPKGAAEAPPDERAEPRKQLVLAEWYDVLLWLWCPEEIATRREQTHRINYRTWISQGLIHATDGDVTDYDVIRADLQEIAGRYRIVGTAYDPFNATHLANQLTSDGMHLERFQQTPTNFNGPLTLLEQLVSQGRLHHGGHPVLRWMVGNCVAVRNGLGYVMLSRKKSADKIDGVVATAMGLAMAMNRKPPGNFYETHDLEIG